MTAPDRSFRTYAAQSSTFATLRANRRLWKANLCLAVAGLLVAGAGCVGTTTANPPIETPVYSPSATLVPTDEDILRTANDNDLLYAFCIALYEADDAGDSRSESRSAFARGYRDAAPGTPAVSGTRVFDVMADFCDYARDDLS